MWEATSADESLEHTYTDSFYIFCDEAEMHKKVFMALQIAENQDILKSAPLEQVQCCHSL